MKAAFFDLDKTVIAKPSIAAFGGVFRREGLINRRLVVRALFGQLIFLYMGADEERLQKVRESMLEVTKGWNRDKVRQIVRETLLETVEPIIYAEALELIEAHRAAGDLVYLVSTSPEEVVKPLSEFLGVDGAIASIAQVDEDGNYTGTMAFFASGPSKATAITVLAERLGIELAESSAYSDSVSDIPMLEAVGHPVAVNPDRGLSKEALARGWEIRQFTKPIRLRDRSPVSASMATTGLALGAAAALAWHYNPRRKSARVPAWAGSGEAA